MKFRVYRKTLGRDLLVAEFSHLGPAQALQNRMRLQGLDAYVQPDPEINGSTPDPPGQKPRCAPDRGRTFPQCPLKTRRPPPCDPSFKVAAVIPAHNEESTVRQAVEDILRQSYPVEPIVVVNDCSTDRTADVLAQLAAHVPQLRVISTEVPRLRAGAVNCGLQYLADKPVDLVMVADADSRFDRNLVKEAVRYFWRYERLGGVCSTSGVVELPESGGSWFRRIVAAYLWHLQRLDCAGFDATRTASWQDVQILHGLCTVFRLQALLSVNGYTSGHLLEDYDLTLRLKKAGWRAMFSPRMRAWTIVPTTFRSFFRQRLRWMRGGVDILLQHGVNRFTRGDFFAHALFLMLLAGVAGYLAVSPKWRAGYSPHPLPIALAVMCFVWSMYRLKFVPKISVKDVLLRATVIPELAMAVALSALQLMSYYLSIFRRPQKW